MSPAKSSPAGKPRDGSTPRSEQPRQSEDDTRSEFRPGCLPPTLLVVDDDPVIRQELVNLLVMERYFVTSVGTGEEALLAVRGVTYNIALIDLRLPDADGIELLEKLTRLDPRMAGIVITGYGTVDHAVRAIRSGAAEFLTKPFQPEVVLLTIKRQLEMQFLKQENALLKKTVLKGGGVRVRDFEPDELDPKASGRGRTEYDRGLKEGERRAQAGFAAQRAKEQTLLANALREVERTARGLSERIESQSATLAFEIATKVVHEAAAEKQELIASLVRDALTRIKDQWQDGALVTIRAHPQDVPALEQVRDQLNQEADPPANLRIEPDPSVSAGGCRVETATRVVDATLEAQLVRLGEALKRRSLRESR